MEVYNKAKFDKYIKKGSHIKCEPFLLLICQIMKNIFLIIRQILSRDGLHL